LTCIHIIFVFRTEHSAFYAERTLFSHCHLHNPTPTPPVLTSSLRDAAMLGRHETNDYQSNADSQGLSQMEVRFDYIDCSDFRFIRKIHDPT
jgi:hypothetical protein